MPHLEEENLNSVERRKNRQPARALGRRFWKLFSYLPVALRGPILRRLFRFTYDLPKDLVFKRAETEDEIGQAFRILYEGFRERGLAKENDNRIRVTKYHALPSTAILVAKLGDEVIATLSLVVDSGLGLPLENLWNIDFLRRQSLRIAEVSALAIKRGHRSQRGILLFPICKFMYEYCIKILGVDTLVIATHPSVQDFYRCIMQFSPIDDYKVHTYNFVQGAEAVGQYLRINGPAEAQWAKLYGGLDRKRDLYRYFVETELSNFQFPQRAFFKAGDVIFTPGLLEYFFNNQTDVLESLSEKDKLALNNIYFYGEYRSVIGVKVSSSDVPDRQHARFTVLCHCRVQPRRAFGTSSSIGATALEASRLGLKLRLSEPLPVAIGDEIKVSVQLGPQQSVDVVGKVIWELNDLKQVGIILIGKTPQQWSEFVDYLEDDLLSRLDQETGSTKKIA